MSRLRALAALAALALCALPAAAMAETPPGLVDVLHKFVRAVSATDADAFARLFTADPSITDTVFPYHWQGTNAASHYLADLQHDVKADGLENLRLAYDGDPFVVARPGFAYAALHLFVQYRAHGTDHRDPGIFSLSLRQDGKDWKISSATWSYTRSPGQPATE